MSNLKTFRKAAGLTQTELAERVGTSKNQISNYETGFRSLSGASGEVLLKLARALGVTIEQLIEGDCDAEK